MRKITFLLLVIIFFTSVHSVFAAASFTTARNDGSGVWTEVSSFGLTQKPWLHISVPGSDLANNWTFSFWNYPAPGSSYFLGNPLSAYREIIQEGLSDLYLAFNNETWAEMVKPGDWNISAATILFQSSGSPYSWTTVSAYDGNPSFKVTPEPVSSVLFLLGGGALAVTRKLRRKA